MIINLNENDAQSEPFKQAGIFAPKIQYSTTPKQNEGKKKIIVVEKEVDAKGLIIVQHHNHNHVE